MSVQAQLEADLKAQGFTTEVITVGGQPFVLLRDFTVSSGRFEGKIIDLALEVQPSYPQHLAAALHVKAEPKLLPPGRQPNGYNVLEGNSPLGPDWQYWSFNFTDAWRGGRGASLSAIINQVMDNA
jgi:hypothetical protein